MTANITGRGAMENWSENLEDDMIRSAYGVTVRTAQPTGAPNAGVHGRPAAAAEANRLGSDAYEIDGNSTPTSYNTRGKFAFVASTIATQPRGPRALSPRWRTAQQRS